MSQRLLGGGFCTFRHFFPLPWNEFCYFGLQYTEQLGEGIVTTPTHRWGEQNTGKLSNRLRSNKWEVWTDSGTPTFQTIALFHLFSFLHLWSLNHTASTPAKPKCYVQTCLFKDALPQGQKRAKEEEGVWEYEDFNGLHSLVMMFVFHLPFFQEDFCALLTAFPFTWSQKMLFSTLVYRVATHLITSAANLTQSVPLNQEHTFVFCALSSYPPTSVFI